jgi:hypothetical protein
MWMLSPAMGCYKGHWSNREHYMFFSLFVCEHIA